MKNYFTSLLLLLSFACSSQNILISELADPNDDATCRFVEIFCHGPGPCNLSGFALQRWTNGNATPTTSSNVSLTSLGTLQPNEIAVIANTSSFFGCYGFNANIAAGTGGPADSNGDDQIAIIDGSSIVIDIFGVPGEDGSGTCHEFENGRAERKSSVTLSNPTFNEAEWNVWADSPVGGCTCHVNQAQNVVNMDPLSSILPVELVEFRAQKILSSNRLIWKTLSEINNDYFEILRSSDGFNFKSIGKVSGNGNSNKKIKYEFNDNRPTIGFNYYKLKQVDLDGRFEFSYVIKLENKSNKIKIYPTNIINNIIIEIEDAESAKLTVMNSMGSVYKAISLTSSINSIDISYLPSGIYYAKVESPTQYFIERIVKY